MSFFSLNTEYNFRLIHSEFLRKCIAELNIIADIEKIITSYLICPHCNTEYDEDNGCFCFYAFSSKRGCLVYEDNGVLSVFVYE